MPPSLNGWDAASVIVKTITYAATFGAAGGVFYLRASYAVLVDSERLAIRRWTQLLALLCVLASGARIAVTAASMSGETAGLFDAELARMVMAAGEWRAFAARVLGLLAAAPAFIATRRPSWAHALGAAAAASSFAWVGHVRATVPLWPSFAAAAHLVCVAFWIGALVPLLLVARSGDLRRTAAASVKFAAAATYAVAVLLLAGIALLYEFLGAPSAAWFGDYGRSIMVKLALVAGLLCCAALNKLRFTPRLLAGDAGALSGLRRSIKIELALALSVLLVTAFVTTLLGPPSLG